MATTFDRNVGKLLDFGHLEKPVKNHLKNVYSTLSMALLAATAGAYVHLFTNLLQAGILTIILALGLVVAVHFLENKRENVAKRMGCLMGFAFFSGMNLGPLMEVVTAIDESIVPTALIGTAVIFICFSMSALLSNDRRFIYLGGALFSGLSWMMMLGFMNIFFRSTLIFKVELYVGLVVMCGFVLYDTQLIVEKSRRGDNDYIWHCVDLFIDLIGIFRRLMIILADKDSNKKKRRD